MLKQFSWLFTFIILIVTTSGCSVIGLKFGAAADSDNPDRVELPITDIERIKPGTIIEIVLRSDDTLSGKYKGIDQMSGQEYESIFHEFIDDSNEPDAFPAPGDTITILDLNGNQISLVLMGYNMGYLSGRRIGEEKTIAILTRNISNMTLANGKTISGTDLEEMISDRKLPVFQTLVLDEEVEVRIVPADSIVQVIEINKNNRIWKGFAIGLAIDLVILTWFIFEIQDAFDSLSEN